MKLHKNVSIIIINFRNAIQVYVCMSNMSTAQFHNFSSHLLMVHGVNGDERAHHIKMLFYVLLRRRPKYSQ